MKLMLCLAEGGKLHASSTVQSPLEYPSKLTPNWPLTLCTRKILQLEKIPAPSKLACQGQSHGQAKLS